MLTVLVIHFVQLFVYIINMHKLDTLHNHFHFIKTQNLDIFRASLALPQEALHEQSFGGCSVL
jgi:hypothetical protein